MPNKHKLGEILVQSGVIDDFQLRSALGEQQRWGRRLGMTLIKMGFLEEPELVRALAAQLDLPVAHLAGKRIHPDVLDLVPVELAEKRMCLPLFIKDEAGIRRLYLGIEDPCDLEALDDLAFRTGMEIQPVLVGPAELCEAIDRFYRGRGQGLEVAAAEPGPPPTLERKPPAPAAGPGATGGSREPSSDLDPGETAPLVEPAASAPRQAPAADDRTRLVLQALTQLLIDKGLVDRGELMERVQALQAALDAPGGASKLPPR